MKQIRKLTNDKLSYDKKTGEVLISEVRTGEKTKGTELISTLIKESETITIDYQNSLGKFKGGGYRAQAENQADAENGTGSNGIVNFDPDAQKPLLYVLDSKTGKTKIERKRPSKISLGHELIHGLHYVLGNKSSNSDNTTYSYTDDAGKVQTETKKTEETRTVGIGGNKGDITENDLRNENNRGNRIAY